MILADSEASFRRHSAFRSIRLFTGRLRIPLKINLQPKSDFVLYHRGAEVLAQFKAEGVNCGMSSTTVSASVMNSLEQGSVSTALEAVLHRFGCQAGTVHVLKDGVLNLAANHGIPPQIAEIVKVVPIGKGIAGLAAERRAPVDMCNLQTDTSGQARPAAKTTGMQGSIAVPMLVDGELKGVLGVAKIEAHDWTAAEKDELLAIAAEFGKQCQP